MPPIFYLFGYDTPGNNELRPVFFSGSALEPCELKKEDYVELYDRRFPEGVSETYDPISGKDVFKFASNAPAAFSGREIPCPGGYYFLALDNRDHILLTDYKRSLIVMDNTGNVVSRCFVKGDPVDFRDGFILTEGPGSEFAHEYSPTDCVRIYRLQYQM